MDSVGSRIRARLDELKKSQGWLADQVGMKQPSINSLIKKPTSGSKFLVAIAAALGVSPNWLNDGTEPKFPSNHELKADLGRYQPNGSPATGRPTPSPYPDGAPMLPVLGMAECGPDGWSLWNGDVIDTIPRPHNLVGALKAFAIYIVGDSMEPRYHAGELAHVHPGKPITIGAYVLVQVRPDHDGETPKAVVKRLVKRTGSKIVLEQYNPPKKIDVSTADIVSIHRIVGSGEG